MLTGPQIEKAIKAGHIEIEPFNEELINPNSYDLCLGPELLIYKQDTGFFDMRDRQWVSQICDETPLTHNLDVSGGYLLKPGDFVLGHTIERTYTPRHVPLVEGKSSIGRIGLSVHITAGAGDLAFNGEWTLEMSAVVPVVLRPRLPVCQVFFFTVEGEIGEGYRGRYCNQTGPTPAKP